VRRLVIPVAILIFIAAIVVVAIVCSEDVATSAPGEAATSSCTDCHSDIELLEQVAEVVEEEEEPEESEGEG
jgi:hypothetical protein